MRSSESHLRAISQEMPQPSITKISLKITYLKLHSYLPKAYELKNWFCFQWCGTVICNVRRSSKKVILWVNFQLHPAPATIFYPHARGRESPCKGPSPHTRMWPKPSWSSTCWIFGLAKFAEIFKFKDNIIGDQLPPAGAALSSSPSLELGCLIPLVKIAPHSQQAGWWLLTVAGWNNKEF